MPTARHILLALTMLGFASATGCSSSSSSAGLGPAMKHYDDGSLSLAKMEAQQVYQRQDGDHWEAAWIIGGEPAHLPVDERFGLMLMVVADGEQRLPLNQTANMWLMRYDILPGLPESLHGDILLHVDPDMPDVPSLQDVFEMLPRFGSAPRRVDWQAEAPRVGPHLSH